MPIKRKNGAAGRPPRGPARFTMPAREYRKALDRLRLSQGQAALIFNGKTARSGRRWVKEGAPFHVALIIELMRRLKLSPAYINKVGREWRARNE